MLLPCYRVAGLAGSYVVEDGVTALEGAMNAGRLTNLVVKARNLGAQGTTGSGLTGVLTALDAGAHVLDGAVGYPAAGPRTTVLPTGSTPFQVALDDTVTPGRMLRFQIQFTSSNGVSRDTIVELSGTPTVLFPDGASGGTTSWNIAPSGAWSVVVNDAAHPSRYFAQRGS